MDRQTGGEGDGGGGALLGNQLGVEEAAACEEEWADKARSQPPANNFLTRPPQPLQISKINLF